MATSSVPSALPQRFHSFGPMSFVLGAAALALIITAFNGIDFSIVAIIEGGPRLTRLLGQMWPLAIEKLPRPASPSGSPSPGL